MNRLDDALTPLRRELEAFLALLEEEAMALASGNAERLSALSINRDQLTRRLAEQWQTLTAQLGQPAHIGIVALRDKAFGDSPPSRAWQALEKLAHEAARLNQVNGRLIEEQMRHTQAAMQVLQNAAASRSLYGADGRVTDFLNINRSIDSA